MDFFASLQPLEKALWIIALLSSLIFLIQTIMTFVGSDAMDGLEPDFNSNFDGADEPFQLFSFRNLINFLLGFSWTGISLYPSVESPVILISIATVVGVLFVAIFFFIIKQVLKLGEDNTFHLKETIHKNAEVYLSIPPARSGKGKIIISIRGSVHELEAITDEDKIETGRMVKVLGLENDNLLIVGKI
jgi:hypothetical protein